jgi:hypothetical protein
VAGAAPRLEFLETHRLLDRSGDVFLEELH